MKRPSPLVNVTGAEYTMLVNFWHGAPLPRPCRKRMIAAGILTTGLDGTLHFTPGGLRWIYENAPSCDWPLKDSPAWAEKNALEEKGRGATTPLRAREGTRLLASIMGVIMATEARRYRRND